MFDVDVDGALWLVFGRWVVPCLEGLAEWINKLKKFHLQWWWWSIHLRLHEKTRKAAARQRRRDGSLLVAKLEEEGPIRSGKWFRNITMMILMEWVEDSKFRSSSSRWVKREVRRTGWRRGRRWVDGWQQFNWSNFTAKMLHKSWSHREAVNSFNWKLDR